jgi:hypothetical protein
LRKIFSSRAIPKFLVDIVVVVVVDHDIIVVPDFKGVIISIVRWVIIWNGYSASPQAHLRMFHGIARIYLKCWYRLID